MSVHGDIDEELMDRIRRRGTASIAYKCGIVSALSTFAAVLAGTVGLKYAFRGNVNKTHEKYYSGIPEGYMMAANHASVSGFTHERTVVHNITRHAQARQLDE